LDQGDAFEDAGPPLRLGRRLRHPVHRTQAGPRQGQAREVGGIVMKTKTKTDQVQSTAQVLASFDREYLLNLAMLYHIDVWDELITKEALVAMIAQAVWN
jgi:hypothetical protein